MHKDSMAPTDGTPSPANRPRRVSARRDVADAAALRAGGTVEWMTEFIHGSDWSHLVFRQGFTEHTLSVHRSDNLDALTTLGRLGQLRLYDGQGSVRGISAPVRSPDANLVVEAGGWPNPFSVFLFRPPYVTQEAFDFGGADWEWTERWLWVPLPMYSWRVTHASKARLWTLGEMALELSRQAESQKAEKDSQEAGTTARE